MPESVTAPVVKSGNPEDLWSLEAGLDSLQSSASPGRRRPDLSRILLPLAAF